MKDFGIKRENRLIPRSLHALYPETKRDQLYYAFIKCSEPFLAYTLYTGTQDSKSKKMSEIHEVNCLQFYSLYTLYTGNASVQ